MLTPGELVLPGSALSGYAAKSSGFTVAAAERGYLFDCTGTFTIALTAAATCGAAWSCWIRTVSGTQTVNPNGSELINSALTASLSEPRSLYLLTCTGSAFYLKPHGSVLNVRDFGALGDGASDDSIPIAAAITASVAAGTVGSVFFPSGSYRCNITLSNKVNLVGAGNQLTIISSFSSTGYAVTLNDRDGAWNFSTISDMQIGRGAASEGGVRYGGDSYVTDDELTGRWIFNNVNFYGDVGIYKQTGNIGNRFNGCQFRCTSYGYYAYRRAGGSIMHAGADSFYGCHFDTAAKAAVFINSGVDGSGQTDFHDCIMEGNAGFGLFVKAYTGSWSPGILLDSLWIEDNATGGTIAIHDGATGLAGATTNYTARDVYLSGVLQAHAINGMIRKLTLVSSVLTCDKMATGDASDDVTFDSASAIIVDNLSADKTQSNSYYANSVVNCARASGNSSSFFQAKPRSTLSRRYAANVRFSETFEEATPQTVDTVPFARVADGTLFEVCAEATAPDALRHVWALGTIATNKYIVWTMDIKRISGTITELAIYNGGVLTTNFGVWRGGALPASQWVTIGGFTNTLSIAAFTASLQMTFSNGAVWRAGGLQILEFDTLQQAMEYSLSGYFTPPATRARTFYGSAIPVTGTWIVGDKIWFTAPTATSATHAICTTGGTPGTWTSYGSGTVSYVDANFSIVGSGDATKILKFEVDGFTTGNTRMMTPPNASGTLAILSLAQTWSADQTFSTIAGIGGATSSAAVLNLGATNPLSGASQLGIRDIITLTSAATTAGYGTYAAMSTAAAFFTCPQIHLFFADGENSSLGATSTITRFCNFSSIKPAAGTNKVGFLHNANGTLSFTGTWAFLNTTTDPSYFGGAVTQAAGRGWGVTNIATAAGTTVLTSSSTSVQIFTGSTTQTVTLPAANLLGAGIGVVFVIKNRSSGNVTINRAGSDTIDGGTSTVLTGGLNSSVTLVSDGVSEWVLA